MLGVFIAIGAIVAAAMFLVLYVRATAAEHRAASLQRELDELRAKTPGQG